MSKSERLSGGIDLSNVSVAVCGLKAKYWLIYFIIVQVVLGISNLVYLITRIYKGKGPETSSGILNLICVVLLLTAFWCQSKSFFTILAVIMCFDTFTECYLLFCQFLLAFEANVPYYTDFLILLVFSLIRVFFSWLFTVVLMRLSWCNGLPDEHDLEKMAIYECIQEMGVYQCQNCSDHDDDDDSDKID